MTKLEEILSLLFKSKTTAAATTKKEPIVTIIKASPCKKKAEEFFDGYFKRHPYSHTEILALLEEQKSC